MEDGRREIEKPAGGQDWSGVADGESEDQEDYDLDLEDEGFDDEWRVREGEGREI